jgi:hypothetical protein
MEIAGVSALKISLNVYTPAIVIAGVLELLGLLLLVYKMNS